MNEITQEIYSQQLDLSAKSVSVIIPVYNEADNIQPLCEEIIAELNTLSCPYEILFVDDGSQDNTVLNLQQLSKNFSTVKYISHKSNMGQSVALCTGARHARYPILVTLDGDGQNDPADIKRLLSLQTDLNTVVLGIRSRRKDNILKKISSRIGNSIRFWILKDDCLDTGCSLKVFSKEAFMNLPHFNHMHRFLPALFKRAGCQLKTLSVNHRSRKFGVSKYGVINRLFVGIHDLIGVRWLMRRPCQVELLK